MTYFSGSDNDWIELLVFTFLAFFVQPWLILARIIWRMPVIISDAMAALRQITPERVASHQPKETALQAIERKAKRTVSIETSSTVDNLAKCNPQTDSSLWQLPQELRDLVFSYASSQSPDPAHSYRENAYYYNLQHTARHKTYTNFHLTCRRAWLEANGLPMQNAEHTFWFQRGPFDPHGDDGVGANLRHEMARYSHFFRSLTDLSLRNVQHIHLYMQMFYAEQVVPSHRIATFFPHDLLKRGLRPKVLEITVRHTDWYYWETDEPLRLDSGWVQAILDSVHLGAIQEFKLELETLKRKKDQIDPIVERLKALEGRPKLADPTLADCDAATKLVFKSQSMPTEWSRSSRYDDKDWPIYAATPTLNLQSTTLTWHNRSCPVDASSLLRLPAPAIQDHPTPRMYQFRGPIRLVRSANGYDGAWFRSRVSQKTDLAWAATVVTHERNVEEVWRHRFERMMGDWEVERLEKEWKVKGSLLRFG